MLLCLNSHSHTPSLLSHWIVFYNSVIPHTHTHSTSALPLSSSFSCLRVTSLLRSSSTLSFVTLYFFPSVVVIIGSSFRVIMLLFSSFCSRGRHANFFPFSPSCHGPHFPALPPSGTCTTSLSLSLCPLYGSFDTLIPWAPLLATRVCGSSPTLLLSDLTSLHVSSFYLFAHCQFYARSFGTIRRLMLLL